MTAHRAMFRIKTMARVLCVSRSGYYAWINRDPGSSPRRQRHELINQRVAAAFVAQKGRSGSPRLTLDLQDEGFHCNEKTVAKSLREQGLRAKAAKKFKATTNSNHGFPVAKNLLNQNFEADKPNQKWVGDITYLWTDEGWLYLAVIIDLYSRMVVGWSLSERMTTSLVADALKMALWNRHMPTGVIVHSDRGSQYCSKDYQEIMCAYQLICSMSAKGNCYDNACAESFFHSLKVELIHGERFFTRDALKQQVFEYIEVDYNRNRRHSTLGYVSPVVFEAKKVA